MIQRFIFCVFLANIFLSNFAQSSKILIMHPMFTGSHVLTLRSLAETLVAKGHSVHVVKWLMDKPSPYERSDPLPYNLTVTTLTFDNSDGRYSEQPKEKKAAFVLPEELVWKLGEGYSLNVLFEPGLKNMFPFLKFICATIISNHQLTKELKAIEYDLVIVDYIWNDCAIIYSREVLKIPVVVGFWGITPETLESSPRTNFIASVHIPLSPLAIRGPDDPELSALETFKDRVFQYAQIILGQMTMWIYFSYISEATQRLIPGSCSPLEAQQNLNGVLVNYDPVLDVIPRAIPTNHLQMGGIQILSKTELDSTVLPKEILDWINVEESAGTIFFSIGLTLASENMPKHVIKYFLEAFSKFPQFRVLFQLGGNVENVTVPSNVKIIGWVSQQKILAHSKTKLFVNHCGLQGITESVFYGVPIVCMPITNDAFMTLAKVTVHGIGVGVSLRSLSTDEITSAIQRVIFISSYARNVKRLSSLMKDVKESPMIRSVDFLEHLLRRSKLNLPNQTLQQPRLSFLEYFYLDILFVITLFGIVYVCISIIILKKTLSLMYSNLNEVKG